MIGHGRIGGGGAAALRRLARAEDGALVVFSLFVLVVMLMAGGLAIDTMRHERERARLQTTLDRAVLAASNLDQDLDPSEVVEGYFEVAGLAQALGDVTPDVGLNFRAVCADAARTMDTMLLHLAGVDTLHPGAGACAEQHATEVEISLVLDMSGSMDDDQRLPRLQLAAKEFVETLLDDRLPGQRTTISIVPFASQVSAGDRILRHLHVTAEHEFSHCVNFDPSDYRETVIRHSASDPLRRTSNFAWTTARRAPTGRERHCPQGRETDILPWSDDAEALAEHIDGLIAAGGTSIDVGVKWGAALLDPSMGGILNALADDGDVEDTYRDRPAAYGADGVLKVMVVLSDGENAEERRLTDAFRDGPSGFLVDPRDDLLLETSYLNDRYTTHWDRPWKDQNYFHHHDDEDAGGNAWHDAPDGGRDAFEMTWPQLFQRIGVNHFIYIVAESYGDAWYRNFPRHEVKVPAKEKDRRTSAICSAARDAGIVIYAIGFEAPEKGRAALRDCAKTEGFYYDAKGIEISTVFRSIASAIQDLRLTR